MVTLTINSQSQLYLVSKIPGSVLNRIKARLTFPNPAHQEAEKRGPGLHGSTGGDSAGNRRTVTHRGPAAHPGPG